LACADFIYSRANLEQKAARQSCVEAGQAEAGFSLLQHGGPPASTVGSVSTQRQDGHLEYCLVDSTRAALKMRSDSANQAQEATAKIPFG